MISVKGIVTIFPRKKFLISGSASHEYRTGKKTVNAAKKKLMQCLINTGSSVAAVYDCRKLSSQRQRCSQSAARNRRRFRAILHVPVFARERQVRPAGWVQLCEQCLVNGNVTASKSVRRAGNIKTPYAIRRFIASAKPTSVPGKNMRLSAPGWFNASTAS
jgi:hypothetical protein